MIMIMMLGPWHSLEFDDFLFHWILSQNNWLSILNTNSLLTVLSQSSSATLNKNYSNDWSVIWFVSNGNTTTCMCAQAND